jgi:hypothetical protein
LHLINAAADRHTAFCKIDWSRGWTNWGFYSGHGKGVVSSPKVEKDSGAHAASYSIGAEIHFRAQSGQGIHLLRRLRMIGAILPLPLYAFRDNFTSTYVVWMKRSHTIPLLLSISFWFGRSSLYLAFSVLAESCWVEHGDLKEGNCCFCLQRQPLLGQWNWPSM